MVTITIGNSYSKVEGLTTTQFKELRELLSYEIDSQAAFFSKNHFNTKRYCIDKKGEFASGLCARVVKFLVSSTITYDLCFPKGPKVVKVDHKAKLYKQPYPAQVTALCLALENARAALSLPTGSGKSFVIALIVAKAQLRTLIVVPNLELKRQLTEDFETQFDDMSHIKILNIDSPELDVATNYDMLIIDEAHHVAAKTYQKLNRKQWLGISRRYFLTATPFRNNTEENLLFEGICGEVIYRLSYQECVSQGLIAPVEAFTLKVPKTKTDGYTWAEVYKDLVVDNEARNEAIASLMVSLPQNTLCLVKEVRHGQILADLTGIPFANGADDESRMYIQQFAKGEIKDLIATTGLVGEGTDTKACEVVIIAGLGKAKGAFMQQVGRSVRKYPGKDTAKVIIISDSSHKWTRVHYNEQKKILLQEYGVIPIEIS